jgi:hypothetical protein
MRVTNGILLGGSTALTGWHCKLRANTEGPGANNLFEYNTLDKCSYESSDTGAFYTCGQMANAFVNRGNELRTVHIFR